MSDKKIFQVGPNQVRVRAQPGLSAAHVRWLDPGTRIECEPDSRREVDGYVWWRHANGWSAERTISGSEIYLFAAVAAPTPSVGKNLFQVGSEQVRVRSDPGLRGAFVRWLQPGEFLEVEVNSRREVDGYVWWKHQFGWSAERNLNGQEVYLIDVPDVIAPAPTPATPAPASPTPATPAATAPSQSQVVEFQPPPPKKAFKVASVKVRIRTAANLRADLVRWLDPGTLLDVDGNSRCEVDGYVWWRHNEGWTAERNVAGSELYLVDPSTPVDIPAPRTNEPPTLETLPLHDSLFKRLPVDFDKILWWQYFGNNDFQYRIWQRGDQWYKYSQSLHGGLDFGNSRDPGVLVYAGVEGTFKFHDRSSTRPNGLWVKVGDYTIIYGHLINPRLFRVGDPIGVNTVLGEIQFGGENHLHLEIRYRDRWIVNPLLFMPEEMRNQIIRKFLPGPKYFYRDANWNQWQSPLDQPILVLGGPVIGPNAR